MNTVYKMYVHMYRHVHCICYILCCGKISPEKFDKSGVLYNAKFLPDLHVYVHVCTLYLIHTDPPMEQH